MKLLTVLAIAFNIIFCIFGVVASIANHNSYSHRIDLNATGVLVASILFGVNVLLLLLALNKTPSMPSIWPFIVLKRKTLEEKAKLDKLLEEDQEK